MQRNYTRTKAANPNPNMRRNVIILAVAIAAGTTVALLIGFWPSTTQQQKQLMTTTEANAFLSANLPPFNAASGMIAALLGPFPATSSITYSSSSALISMVYHGTYAQTLLAKPEWKNMGLAQGVILIFVHATIQIPVNTYTITPTAGIVVMCLKTGVTISSYQAPQVVVFDAGALNQAAATASGYTIINV